MPVRPLIDSLLLYDPNRSTATANVWVAHPSPSEEAALGKLFMVVSIDSNDRLNHEIINALQEQLKHHYYRSTESKFSTAFEQALHQTNQHLHQLVIEGIDSWVNNLHCLVGVMVNDQVMISTAGTMLAYRLVRGRILDLVGEQSATPKPLRIFSTLIDGKIDDQEQLLFCTPTVLDYFSLEKIRRIMVEHSPAESVRQLETHLLGSEQNIAIAALIIKAEGHADPIATHPPIQTLASRSPSVAPQRSMETLIARERATEQLLTPSVWPSIRDTLGQIARGILVLIRTKLFHRPPKRVIPAGSQPATLRRPSLQGTTALSWSRLTNLTRRSLWNLQTKIAALRARQQSPIPQTEAPAESQAARLPRSHGSWINRLVAWFGQLPIQQRLILTIGLVLVFIFAATTVMSRTGNDSTAVKPDEVAQQIEDYLNKAEAALSYGGEETAQTHTKDATTLLASLPSRLKADQARRQPLADRLAKVRSSLTHIVTVANPEILIQLAEVAPTLRPQQLYWTGDQAFSYDPSRQTGIVVDLGSADAPTVIRNTVDTGQPTTGSVVASTIILFVTDRQGFVELDLVKGTWRPIDATWPTGTYTIQSLSFFQNRVYALDRAQGDIIRFSRGSSSLGTGARWLKESATLKSARGLAVDGSVFILQPQGQVEEYFNGRRGELSLATVEPPLTNPTRLWTSTEATHFYLIDPAQKRVVVFDKNGKLTRQYQSESWTALVDIAVNEATKTALVLSGTTLYRLPLQD